MLALTGTPVVVCTSVIISMCTKRLKGSRGLDQAQNPHGSQQQWPNPCNAKAKLQPKAGAHAAVPNRTAVDAMSSSGEVIIAVSE